MTLHKDMTGADLHEPKGIGSATSGQVYRANGSGSGSWQSLVIPPGTFYKTTAQFSTSGTWTKPSNCFGVELYLIGGGGGGGGGEGFPGTGSGSTVFGSLASVAGGVASDGVSQGAAGTYSPGTYSLFGMSGSGPYSGRPYFMLQDGSYGSGGTGVGRGGGGAFGAFFIPGSALSATEGVSIGQGAGGGGSGGVSGFGGYALIIQYIKDV